GEQESAGVAAVGSVGKYGAVKGERQLQTAKRKGMPAAVLLAVHFAEPLLLEPFADFIVGHDRGTRATGDGDGVADMVAVPVGHQDEVSRHLLGLGCRGGVAGQEGVHQNALAVAFQEQAGMAEPANTRCHDKSSAGASRTRGGTSAGRDSWSKEIG